MGAVVLYNLAHVHNYNPTYITTRLNKYHKGLIKNPHRSEENFASSLARDGAANFCNVCEDTPAISRSHLHPGLPHDCVLWGKGEMYMPTNEEVFDLEWQGVDVGLFSVTQFEIAYILNTHFRAAEWGQHPWCGSVVTCVIEGRSLYARVKRFLKVEGCDCPGFASVDWFSAPTYLFDENIPLGVCVTEDGEEVVRDVGTSVIRITQIDPSPVIVERDVENGRFYMMRDSGYDTRLDN